MTNLSPFVGNRIRTSKALDDWHAGAEAEIAIEPEITIIDAHHHLYGNAADTHHYLLDELNADIDAGHRVVGTVYVEAYHAGWHTEGPLELRSTGEVERILRLTAAPDLNSGGTRRVANAIVSYVDLTSGAGVASVLDTHLSAGQGRLRGVRQQATLNSGKVGHFISNTPIPGLLDDRHFRNGYKRLQEHGLSFDATVYHTQLAEVASLADAFPDITIVLNHIGIPIGVEEYARNRKQVFDGWRTSMLDLALRPNVNVKIGGLGMPVLGFGFETGERPANSSELAAAWQPLILACIEVFGSGRCLFESNFPVDKQSCSYVSLWNAYKIATRCLSQSERKDVFSRTAARVYRLPELGL